VVAGEPSPHQPFSLNGSRTKKRRAMVCAMARQLGATLYYFVAAAAGNAAKGV